MRKIIMFLIFIVTLMLLSVLFSPFLGATYAHYACAEAPKEIPDIRTYAQNKVTEEWGKSQWSYFDALIKRESNWNSEAQHPKSSAYGLGQFLNGTWKSVGCEKTDNPYKQIDCTIEYVKVRYENPQKTIAFWDKKNWY